MENKKMDMNDFNKDQENKLVEIIDYSRKFHNLSLSEFVKKLKEYNFDVSDSDYTDDLYRDLCGACATTSINNFEEWVKITYPKKSNKKVEIWEFTTYNFDCPECNKISEFEQDIKPAKYVCCQWCDVEFFVKD